MTELERRANDMRADIVRMIAEAGSGHPGGSLSCADILCGAVLRRRAGARSRATRVGRARPLHPGEGPCGAGALRRARPGGLLPTRGAAHAAQAGKPAAGPPRLEPGARRRGVHGLARPGPVHRGGRRGRLAGWTASPRRCSPCSATASARRARCGRPPCSRRIASLDNLVAIVDRNGLQIDGDTADVCDPGDLGAKFAGLRLGRARGGRPRHGRARGGARGREGRPRRAGRMRVIARTVKGKGVSFMENQAGWHGKAPNAEQAGEALAELEARAGKESSRG